MKLELPDIQAGFRKGRGTKSQIVNICSITNKARDLQKTYICFIDYAKDFGCVDQNKLWKILQEMRIPDHLTCLWEICMQVMRQKLELDMEQQTCSKSGKEYVKAVYCHPAYLTYAEYIMWNARLDEAQAEIEIARKSIKNLICRWHHTYGRSEEELKSPLMRVKEESEKIALKLNIHKTKIMASVSSLHGK